MLQAEQALQPLQFEQPEQFEQREQSVQPVQSIIVPMREAPELTLRLIASKAKLLMFRIHPSSSIGYSGCWSTMVYEQSEQPVQLLHELFGHVPFEHVLQSEQCEQLGQSTLGLRVWPMLRLIASNPYWRR